LPESVVFQVPLAQKKINIPKWCVLGVAYPECLQPEKESCAL
jgi:hypothetical protein